jgi:hypothetical protein
MNIDIEKYLSEAEIKEACLLAVKENALKLLGTNESGITTRIARQIVKEEHQLYIQNHKDLINDKIIESINKMSLGSLFFNAFGWSNTGHKILKELLHKHSELLECKLIKILK